MSRIERVRKCGRVTTGEWVAARERNAVVSIHGVHTCASLWACPVCNAKIMFRRSLEIQCAVAMAQSLGLVPAFLTLTMRHSRGDRLFDLWNGIGGAWRKVTSSGSFKRLDDLEGFVKVTEVTHGQNGWHVHLHVLVFLRTDDPDASLRNVAGTMWRTWSTALPALGFADPLLDAQDFRLIESASDDALSKYLTKTVDEGSLGMEMTSSQTKTGNNFGSLTPWQLLTLAAGGDADAYRLWGEWERGSKGRRQISWSRGLRDHLGMGQEESDEEIALRDDTTTHDDVLHIHRDAWKLMVAQPHLISGLLDQPRQLMSAYLTENGIPHRTDLQPGEHLP